MDIPMKAKVQCTDGPGGHSTLVIINPTNKKITHVVVRERQSPHAERLVPIRYITDTTDDVIHLRCSRHELSEMRPLVLTEFVQAKMPALHDGSHEHLLQPYVIPKWVGAKHRSIPPGELGVRREAKVKATDGTVGRVGEFVIDPASGNITHLLLQGGHLWDHEEVTIPITEIERIEEGTVYLALDKKGVKALPTVPVRRKLT
jgi:sporulation protein YlmC with PRC-barrel domain